MLDPDVDAPPIGVKLLAAVDPSPTYNFFVSVLYINSPSAGVPAFERLVPLFICNLLADNYAIPEGEYEFIPDADDNFSGSFVVDKTNNRFSLLPDLVQEAIKSRVTVISEYVQTDWQGMSIAFINTNTS